jgi:hypothetical protein
MCLLWGTNCVLYPKGDILHSHCRENNKYYIVTFDFFLTCVLCTSCTKPEQWLDQAGSPRFTNHCSLHRYTTRSTAGVRAQEGLQWTGSVASVSLEAVAYASNAGRSVFRAFLLSNDLKCSQCDSRMSQFGSSGRVARGAGVFSSPTDWRVKSLAAWLRGDAIGLLTPTYPRYYADWSVLLCSKNMTESRRN